MSFVLSILILAKIIMCHLSHVLWITNSSFCHNLLKKSMLVEVKMGDYTSKQFFYKPGLGASGAVEKSYFDSGLERVDSRLGQEVWLGDPGYQFSGITLYKNGINDDAPYFQAMLGRLGSSDPYTVVIPKGVYLLNSDVTFTPNIHVVIKKGAYLAPARITCSGTIAYADEGQAGTITVNSGMQEIGRASCRERV